MQIMRLNPSGLKCYQANSILDNIYPESDSVRHISKFSLSHDFTCSILKLNNIYGD